MLQRLASLGAGLVLLSLATSGCFTQQGDGVFGPGNSLGGTENNSPALSLKASPARGPGPLDVEFSLSALDRDGGPLTWSLDFGDRTAPAAGNELPARPRHTYEAPGAYVATFKVIGSGESETFVSTISIVVLEGVVPGNTTQGPEEPPEYSPPRSRGNGGGGGGGGGGSSDSESETSTGPGNETTSETGTSTGPPSNGTSSTSESSTSTSGGPTSSESSSSSDTGTSSSTETETYSDPGPTSSSSSSSDTSTSSDPDPTGSESQSSTDPPL